MIDLSVDKEEMTMNNENGQAPAKKASLEEMTQFFTRMSGKDSFGDSKAIITYQTFAMEDEEDSKDKMTIYNISKARCNLSFDKMNPQFLSFEIVFNSYEDTELKLLWGRLQRHLSNERTNPEKTWVFYFNIVERGSVDIDSTTNDTLLIGHLMNPVMFYLSRETPVTMAVDIEKDGELHGGNVIKMLVPLELFSFEVSNDYDTLQWKAEAQRDDAARDYIDNYEAAKWDE